MAEVTDLWPELGNIEKIKSPKSILVEQANFLNEKTKNVLSAKVEPSSMSNFSESIVHFFKISVPALNNYTINLFFIKHSIIFYPLIIGGNSVGLSKEINNESQFIEELKSIFNSEETIKTIKSLYSQATE